MIHPDYLAVDIARDDECRAEYLEPACEAIESLQSELGRIGLGSIDAIFRVEKPFSQMNLPNIVWTNKTADMHLFITPQLLKQSGERQPQGMTWIRKNQNGTKDRHVVVIPSTNEITQITTAHETAHMIGCNHCDQRDCLMHECLNSEMRDKYQKVGHAAIFCNNCLEIAGTKVSKLYWTRYFDTQITLSVPKHHAA